MADWLLHSIPYEHVCVSVYGGALLYLLSSTPLVTPKYHTLKGCIHPSAHYNSVIFTSLMKFFKSNWSQAIDLKLSLFTPVLTVPSEQQNTQDKLLL